jgi:RimJ/RimL family protein N-acetyltransferase
MSLESFEFESEKDVFPPHMTSERLEYRAVTYEEFSVRELYELYSELSERETKYVTFTPYESHIEAKEFIDSSIESFNEGDSAGYFVFTRDSGEFIGTTGFSPEWDRSVAESGIFFFQEYWGNEYSSERGELMIELAFDIYDFDWWVSKCVAENHASASAIEKYVVENGGERIGVLPNIVSGITKDTYEDGLYFKLSQEDWQNNR